jgi:site-specific DNA-methyltransferase (adenine-specific)
MARKPFPGTVAANVMQHGTGAVNVDGCRVVRETDDQSGWSQSGSRASENRAMSGGNYARDAKPDASGRWPANLIHDGSDEVLAGFPETKSGNLSPHHKLQASDNRAMSGPNQERSPRNEFGGDSGSAARFFYVPKCSKADRDGSPHPTMKPTALMQYLCRLVTPPGGTVLDPFTGSGSTGKAAMLEGFNFVGFEREAEYVEIARRRIAEAAARPMLEGIK